jgi:hypothetical protein
MGRRQGSHHKGSRIAAALLVLCLAGCNGGNYGYAVNVSSMQAPAPPPPNASLSVTTTSSGAGFFGALFALGMIGVASGILPFYGPEMDPDRRVAERDCTRPIEDYSANLRCR